MPKIKVRRELPPNVYRDWSDWSGRLPTAMRTFSSSLKSLTTGRLFDISTRGWFTMSMSLDGPCRVTDLHGGQRDCARGVSLHALVLLYFVVCFQVIEYMSCLAFRRWHNSTPLFAYCLQPCVIDCHYPDGAVSEGPHRFSLVESWFTLDYLL